MKKTAKELYQILGRWLEEHRKRRGASHGKAEDEGGDEDTSIKSTCLCDFNVMIMIMNLILFTVHELRACTIARYRVPAGTRLVVNVWKIHRNPRVWENTSAFVPKRFLESYRHIDVRGQQFKLMLFGSSRRWCPGVSFAMQVLHLTLARLLHLFKVKLRRLRLFV
ncbi:DNA mismatch repair protein MSH6-like [Pyrus ussuriensis x Pyrus communis]|uniref:DNA mismatch repair protein MSH6-like n=1 Tax=Pyrus ussuriensis x Pyrus communis TaxID=2448454 RepID=A0A5N5H2W4_9ROSA|nr:DNA mismatch repair protein MSH6-like [Pyrus ussuriensis x Pyrus communis]